MPINKLIANFAGSRGLDRALATALAVYLIAVVGMWCAILARTGGIGYTVDDAYIHGTIAKNLAAHGSFGIIPGEFAAASSSLLWTVLLAVIFFIVGIHAWIPAVLATVFGALTIERSNSLLKAVGAGPVTRAVAIIMAIAYAPLLPIISTGMEHTLHSWATVGLFASLVGVSMEQKTRPGTIFFWAVMAAGARYESLFALPPLLIWLALRGKWKTAIELAAGMALPVASFAAYSLAHGGYALPNSLILKGNLDGAFKFKALQMLLDNQYLFVVASFLLIAALVLLFSRKQDAKRLVWLPASVITMLLIHLQLAKLGWFWRYDGYLVILGVVATAPALVPSQAWLRRLPVALRLVICLLLVSTNLPLFKRVIRAHGEIVHAAGNIHDQQFQMARVVRHLGKGARVAANDLGAVSFLSDASVLDLWGLGDNRIARAKHNRMDIAEFVKARVIEDHIDFVICYPTWFMPPVSLPASSILVERWTLGDNLVCGSDTVVFYGTSPLAAEKLAAALELYRSESKPDPQSTNRTDPISFK